MLEVVEKFYDVWVIKKSMKMDFHWYWNFTFLRKKLKITSALYQTPSQAVLIKLFVERSRCWIFCCCDCDNFRTEMQWAWSPFPLSFFFGWTGVLTPPLYPSYENFQRLDNNLPTHIPQKCLHRNVEGGREVIPPVIFVWGGGVRHPTDVPRLSSVTPSQKKNLHSLNKTFE